MYVVKKYIIVIMNSDAYWYIIIIIEMYNNSRVQVCIPGPMQF